MRNILTEFRSKEHAKTMFVRIMRMHLMIAKIICFIIVLKHVHANFTGAALDEKHDRIVYQKYLEMDKQLRNFAKEAIEILSPQLMEASQHLNLSDSCSRELSQIISGVRNLERWAVSFLDASGKIPSGILNRNTYTLGDFDQCLHITTLIKEKEYDFGSQYCLIEFKPYLPTIRRPPGITEPLEGLMNATKNASEITRYFVEKVHLFYYSSFEFGLCVPSGCTKQDVDHVVKYIGQKMFLSASVGMCTTGDEPQWNNRNIIITCIFVLLGSLSVIGAIYEQFLKRKNISNQGLCARIILCFSVTKNFRSLITTNVQEEKLTCLHGIRVLTLFEVILAHKYGIYATGANEKILANLLSSFAGLIVFNSYLAVDVFLFMSGFVNVYIQHKIYAVNKVQVSTIMTIIHRIWRLYPAYIFSIMLMFLFRSRGPYSHLYDEWFKNSCEEELWKNVLFINNFFVKDKECFPQTWYIACDMQLFLLSLCLIPVLFRYPKRGAILNCFVMVVSMIITAVWCWIKDLPPTHMFFRPDRKTYLEFRKLHITPLSHTTSYLIGICIGYVVASRREIKFSMIQNICGWSLAAFLFTFQIFSTKMWNSGTDYTRIESALNVAVSKPLYILPVSWMVVCCATGQGGIINYILSLKIWHPISRMSYMMYLVSPAVQMIYQANLKVPIEVEPMFIIWSYLGDIVVCILLCLPLVVIYELPFIALEKIIFSRRENEKKVNTVDNTKGYKQL